MSWIAIGLDCQSILNSGLDLDCQSHIPHGFGLDGQSEKMD